MKPKTHLNPLYRNLATAAITVAFTSLCQTTIAADLTWDADTVTTGVQAGSGSWDTTTANWWNGTANVVWDAANAAIFAGADAGSFHDITLAEDITAQKVTFTNSGYRLGAASAQTLSLTNLGDGVVSIATGKKGTIGNNATVRLTAASNTGTRTTLNNGTLNIEAGGVYTRTGQITSGSTPTGGTIGFTGSGGTINVAGELSYNVATPVASGGIVVSNSSGNSVTMNVNSGGVVSSNSTINGIAVVSANSGIRSGVLTVNSGGFVSTTGIAGVTSGINLANGVDSSGTVNLNGGTISTFRINSNYLNTSTNVVSTGGTGIFNFNGGTLTAIANNASFMTGLTRANVRNSGAVVDTNGFNITIGQALEHSDIGGDNATDGGLSKIGAGVLTLSGASTYNGATLVNDGTLDLAGSLASNIVANNGTTVSGSGTTTGSLTMNAGSTIITNTDIGAIIVSGGVNFTGATSLEFNGSLFTGNTYDVVVYGAGGVANLSNLSTTFRGVLNNDAINSKVTFTAGSQLRTWNTTSGTWQTGGSGGQWLQGDKKYFNGDAVVFGNPASASVVTLDGNLLPADVTVNNTNGYTFSGSGSIQGFSSLTKSGNGALNISGSHSYTGPTTINGGTINLSGGLKDTPITVATGATVNGSSTGVISGFASISTGGAVVLAGVNTYSGFTSIDLGGSLQLGDGTTDGSIATSSGIANNGSLVYNLVGGEAYANPISGTGSLIKQGAGTLTLSSAASSFSGGTTVSEGTLVANATGLSGGNVSIATGATLNFSGGNSSSTVGGSGDIFNVGGTGSTNIEGDFSGFTGTFTHNTTLSSSVFNTATATSKNASYDIATVQALSQGMLAAGNGDYTLEIGALSGIANSLFRGGNTATGITTLQIGNLGTDTTFAGSINNGTTKALALTKVGSGKLTLTGTNNYTGTTSVNAGILAVGGNAIVDTGKLVIDGGKVEPTGTEVVDTLFFGATQKAAGNYSAVAGPGVNFVDTVHFTGAGIVSVTSGLAGGFSSWATLNGASAVATDDHDNDGVPNGVEYFIGGPNGNTTGFTALPGVTTVAGIRSVTWTHAADYTGAYGVDFVIETSTTLVAGSWTTETAGGNITLTGNDVKYTFPAGPVKNFVRLRVKAN